MSTGQIFKLISPHENIINFFQLKYISILHIKRHQKITQAKVFENFTSRQHALIIIIIMSNATRSGLLPIILYLRLTPLPSPCPTPTVLDLLIIIVNILIIIVNVIIIIVNVIIMVDIIIVMNSSGWQKLAERGSSARRKDPKLGFKHSLFCRKT